MRNYIAIVNKYFKSHKIYKIYNHNLRLSVIKYLLDKKYHIYKNTSYVFSNDDKDINIIDKFKQLQQEKTKRLKQYYNYKHNSNENEIIEQALILSEEQARYYLDNNISFDEAVKDYMQEIKSKYGLEPIGFQGHFDEGFIDKDGKVIYNFHFHCQFFNFDFEKDKSVLRNLRKKDWENMQDVAQDSFQKNGLDFIRGESKSITGKEHLERIDFIAQQKQNELQELYNILNKEKNNLKEIRKEFDKSSNTYKVLSTSIKTLQVKEKNARIEYQNLTQAIKENKDNLEILEEKIENQEKWLSETRQSLKEFLLEHTQKNSNNKYEIKDMKNFYNEVVDLALYLSNYDLKIKELEEKKSTNFLLKNKVDELSKSVAKNIEATEVKDNEIKSLKSKYKKIDEEFEKIEYENHLLKEFIKDKDLVDDYSSFKVRELDKEEQDNSLEIV
jgi:hypothetical protein